MADKNKLNPCPLCGSHTVGLLPNENCDRYYFVSCWDCGASVGNDSSGLFDLSEQEAIEAWNKRANTKGGV